MSLIRNRCQQPVFGREMDLPQLASLLPVLLLLQGTPALVPVTLVLRLVWTRPEIGERSIFSAHSTT